MKRVSSNYFFYGKNKAQTVPFLWFFRVCKEWQTEGNYIGPNGASLSVSNGASIWD